MGLICTKKQKPQQKPQANKPQLYNSSPSKPPVQKAKQASPKKPRPKKDNPKMAASTRGQRATWDQVGTLDRHKTASAEKRRQLKDLDYHRRQLEKELEVIEDEYSKLHPEGEPGWRGDGPHYGPDKRASWAGYDENRPIQAYPGRGNVGTMPRTRTSLADYRQEGKEKFKVDIDVHEFRPEDVQIKLEGGGELSVEAKREDSLGSKYSTLERRSKVRLPKEVDPSRLSAVYSSNEGILTIQAPRVAVHGTGSTPPTSPGSQNQIPYADSEPNHRDYPYSSTPEQRPNSPGWPSYERGGPRPAPTSIPYYIDDPQYHPRHHSPARGPGRHTSPDRQNQSPIYIQRDDDPGPHYEPLYTPPRKEKGRPKSTPPEINKPTLRPAIRENQPVRRSRPTSEGEGTASPRPGRHQITPGGKGSSSLPPSMGRMTISLTLGRGYTPDQVIVKNIMNYNKFIVFAKADGTYGRKTFRHIFNWPTAINPSTIYAFLKKDGVLHVSAVPICEPE